MGRPKRLITKDTSFLANCKHRKQRQIQLFKAQNSNPDIHKKLVTSTVGLAKMQSPPPPHLRRVLLVCLLVKLSATIAFAAEEVTSLPPADRVRGGEEQEGSKPGGDGKMKLNLNLKDLDGNPSDLTVGAAAVGLMHHAVKSKGPDDNQVNAIAGFGHQIMQLVDEIEKEKKEDEEKDNA